MENRIFFFLYATNNYYFTIIIIIILPCFFVDFILFYFIYFFVYLFVLSELQKYFQPHRNNVRGCNYMRTVLSIRMNHHTVIYLEMAFYLLFILLNVNLCNSLESFPVGFPQ